MNTVYYILVAALVTTGAGTTKTHQAAPVSRVQARREVGRGQLEDGTKVLLLNDSTWTALPATDGSETVRRTGSLEITAGVVLVSNESRPMARMSVSLLDADLGLALADLAMRTSGGDVNKAKRSMGGIWAHYSMAVAGLRDNQLDKPGTVENFIRTFLTQHTLRTVTTDFAGKAVIDSLSPGSYSVHATNMQGYHAMIWDVPITTSDSKQSVVLDNSNSR